MSRGELRAPLYARDPRHAGEFRLIGRLGQGGQGVVYLGEDRRGQRVAVKVLNIDIQDDPRAKVRFAREIEAARRVAPFCTARILDFDIDGELPFIASEFIAGPTLQQRVSTSGPISGSELDRLAVGTAAGLAAIHGANIVHCDLKPANVILGPDWPRVIDFGVAQALDGTGTQTIWGSPGYMSPERYQSDGVGPPADVFGWAGTIAFAASGRPPFGDGAPLAVMRRVVDHPPTLNGLSAELDELLRQCLDKDPQARPAATDVLLHLVAKSRLTLQPAERRSIGELTTRVIPRRLLTDPRSDVHPAKHRAHDLVIPRQRDPASPVAPAAGEETADQREPTWRLSGGQGATRKIVDGPERLRRILVARQQRLSDAAPTEDVPDASGPTVTAPEAAGVTVVAPESMGAAVVAPNAAGPTVGAPDVAGRTVPDVVGPTVAEVAGPTVPDVVRPTVPGSAACTVDVPSGLDPTREMTPERVRAAVAGEPTRPDPAAGGSWPARVRREYRRAGALLLAVLLGLVAGLITYLTTRSTVPAAVSGGAAFVAAYAVRILVGARR